MRASIDMELRHLRHFVAVAEELHFARAADRLGMAQPPLSHSIQNLEAELGVKLFHRTTRKTWLSRAGARLYPAVVRILDSVEAVRALVHNQDLAEPCRLAMGLAEHAAGEPFTRFLFELEHRKPPMPVDLRELAPTELATLVTDRSLDFAIGLERVVTAGLTQRRAWADPLSLLVPLGHPLAERDRVSLHDLAQETFIMPSPVASPGYAAQIEGLIDRHGVRPAKRVVAKHQNTMISLVAAGRGVALLPDPIAHGLVSVAVVAVAEADAQMVSWLLYRDEEPSEGVAFALEVASVIDNGGDLPSEADRGS